MYGNYGPGEPRYVNRKAAAEVRAAFDNGMTELGLNDKVTAFTASDFGRTFAYNGNGTDHAWGSHALVMGGAVDGGKMYTVDPNGTGKVMPDTALNNSVDVGQGRGRRIAPRASRPARRRRPRTGI